jgi:hypothetical protein
MTVGEGVKLADVSSVSVENARPCVAVRAGRKGMLFSVRLAGRSQRRARYAGGDELRTRLEQSHVAGDVLGFDVPAVRFELEPGHPLPASEIEQLALPEAAGIVVESKADGGHAAVVWFAPGVEPAQGARAIATRLAPRVGSHVRGADLEDVAAYLRLEGEDLPTLAGAAKRATEVARGVEGILAAWTEGTSMDDRQTLELDGESAMRHGTSRAELALLLRMLAPNGAEADRVTLRGAPATLAVRVPGDFRGLVLPAASGTLVPLAEVLRSELRSAPLQVVRHGGKRTSFLWVIPREHDRVRVLDQLRHTLSGALPPGVQLAR